MKTTMVIATTNPPSSLLKGTCTAVATPVYIGLAVGIDTTVTLLISAVPVPALMGTAGLAAASSTAKDGSKEDDGD